MVPDDALSLSEIARRLRVNPATVRLWVSQGRLPAYKAGASTRSRWWVKPEDLEAMLAERRDPRTSNSSEVPETGYQPGPDEPGLGMLPSSTSDSRAAGMAETFGTKQEAAEHIRRADAKWTDAVRAFQTYPERLRRLAEAAETQRKAFMFAELCDVKWKARENARGLRLAPELEPGNRLGPPQLWKRFDKAQTSFGEALAGESIRDIANAFAQISAAAASIADALEAERDRAASA
jgi:excisionase family DNA binding protein